MIRRLPYKQMSRQQIPPHFLIDLHSDAAGVGIAQFMNWNTNFYTLKIVADPEEYLLVLCIITAVQAITE